jgi:hypothetical protein
MHGASDGGFTPATVPVPSGPSAVPPPVVEPGQSGQEPGKPPETPEPATLALVAAGLTALAGRRLAAHRRRAARTA